MIAALGPYQRPTIPKSQQKTQTRLRGIPINQYPETVTIEAIPYFPNPLIIPTPMHCMQSKKTKTERMNIVFEIKALTSASELKAEIKQDLRKITVKTDPIDQNKPIKTHSLAKYLAASRCLAPILFPTRTPVGIANPTGIIKNKSEIFLRIA